ncbi:hypothetical protein [Hyphomonas oceanitis]|uniref:Lipoprotein n=1 Tax=Hyphomonas oceanitis SCH89 TaxID=1280953 RepID=A0A059GAJ1_9PROT|nr:hypothetical protein [Hyphomonas oceanitis]KDA03478.1 hypothetical protein HOC_04974 [Hyphomonas oceanitis SCH89]
MRRTFVRIPRLGAGTLAGALLLSACQAPGPRVTPPASPVMPLTVLVEPVEQDGDRINQWGGIVPDTAPAVPVEDGGLSEPEPR